jgi:hypothetical protein
MSGYVMPSQRPGPAVTRKAALRELTGWRRIDPARLRRALYKAAKKSWARAAGRGCKHRLSVNDVVAMFEAQDGRCALTGVEFELTYDGAATRNPLAPSLDRVDLTRGYEPDNTRLVALIANLARCDFGDDAFYEMCKAAVAARSSAAEQRLYTPKVAGSIPAARTEQNGAEE